MVYLIRYFHRHQHYVIFRVHTKAECAAWMSSGPWKHKVIDTYRLKDQGLAHREARRLNTAYRKIS